MERELILKVMKEAGKPVAAGEVATLSGLDRKVVDKVQMDPCSVIWTTCYREQIFDFCSQIVCFILIWEHI